MRRIIIAAWMAYRTLLSVGLIGLLLSALWAAAGSATLPLRLLPVVTLCVVFVCCVLWSAWRLSITRELKIARQLKALEFSRQATLHIGENGDLSITRTLSMKNKAKKPVAETIDEKMGFELTKLPAADWVPTFQVVSIPAEKKISKIYHYWFDDDKPLIATYVDKIRTICWGFQIRPYLEPGEEVVFKYTIPIISGAEVSAFSDAGSHISLVPSRLYSRVMFSVHAPPGHFFEILGSTVLSPEDERDRAEERWLRTWYSAKIDKDDASLLRWCIDWPLPHFKYSTKYRLRSLVEEHKSFARHTGH